MNTLNFAVRSLMKSPGFTLVAIVALALGIGANSAIFSLIDAIFLRPAAICDAGRIVQISSALPERGLNQAALSWPRLTVVRERQDVFSDVAVSTPGAFIVTGSGDPEQIQGMIVSQNYFPLLGVRPRARPQLPARRRSRGRRGGRDPELPLLAEASGGTRRRDRPVDHARRQAVQRDRRDAEQPLGLSAQPAAAVHDAPVRGTVPHAEAVDDGGLFFNTIARLKPGVSIEQARAAIAVIAAGYAQTHSKNIDASSKARRRLSSGRSRRQPARDLRDAVRGRRVRAADRVRETSRTFCSRVSRAGARRSASASRSARNVAA